MFEGFAGALRKAREWLSHFECTAIVGSALALAFCLLVIVPAARQYEYHPANNERYETSQQEPNSGTDSGNDEIARYTLWLAIFTAALVIVSGFQLWFLRRADETARISADAAKVSAEAAVASLDRPWLFLDTPVVNSRTWIEGRSRLDAAIYLQNYGKAPAFVHSIQGFVFISPERRTRQKDVPFDLGTIDALEFPLENEFGDFMRSRVRSADSRERTIEIEGLGNPPESFNIVTAPYIVPFVVPGEERSLWYLIRGKPPISDLPPKGQGIPIQNAMTVYLVGRVLYSGPDEELQMIDFCYESGPDWRMQPFMGRPYNRRYKLGE
jgi:hypothetical protein